MTSTIKQMHTVEASKKMIERSSRITTTRVNPGVVAVITFTTLLIIWSVLDHTIPVWDSAAHLLRGYQCAEILPTHIDFPRKATDLLTLSSFYTPLTYYLHGILICCLGKASWVDVIPRVFWYALSCFSLYLLSRQIYKDEPVAACTVCAWAFYPATYGVSRAFALLDIPMTAMVFSSWWILTVWWQEKTWKNALLLGLTFGLTFLTKQTAILFLIAPTAVVLCRTMWRKEWRQTGMLLCSGTIGVALLIVWAVPNYKAFIEFVAQNQNMLDQRPLIERFMQNLSAYVGHGFEVVTVTGAVTFMAAVILVKAKHKSWIVTVGVLSALAIHSALNWVPQFRYILPALGLAAMWTAVLVSDLWRSGNLLGRIPACAIALYGAFVFLYLSFTPSPLPRIAPLEEISGISRVRKIYGIEQIFEPFWPRPKQDWGHDWIVSTIQNEIGNTPAIIHLFSDTKEFNAGGLAYIVKLRGSTLQPTVFRTWTMAGYDFSYTKAQVDAIQWHVVLENSTAASGCKFRTSGAQNNFERLLSLVTTDKRYRRIGTKALPDGSQLVLIKRSS